MIQRSVCSMMKKKKIIATKHTYNTNVTYSMNYIYSTCQTNHFNFLLFFWCFGFNLLKIESDDFTIKPINKKSKFQLVTKELLSSMIQLVFLGMSKKKTKNKNKNKKNRD